MGNVGRPRSFLCSRYHPREMRRHERRLPQWDTVDQPLFVDTSIMGLLIHSREPSLGENAGVTGSRPSDGPDYRGLGAEYMQSGCRTLHRVYDDPARRDPHRRRGHRVRAHLLRHSRLRVAPSWLSANDGGRRRRSAGAGRVVERLHGTYAVGVRPPPLGSSIRGGCSGPLRRPTYPGRSPSL
jgi:hypothetical protein